MSSAPASVARSHRWRTAAAIITAATALAAVAFLSPRKAARPPAGPASALLSARLDSSHILRGTSQTYLAVSLTAPGGQVTERAPTSVAIVLDHSGSMEGQALVDAKAAAAVLIDQLGPRDELAVVSYSTIAELIVPLQAATPEVRARARATIERLYAEGGTNIPAGLMAGADELVRSRGSLRRMVLISDGQAEPADRPRLIPLASRRAAQGISITTVGVGLEFDEEIMAGIAIAGRGNYHFVEHAHDLGPLFVAELGSLGETILTSGSLRIEPADGIEILDVIGYQLDRDGRAVVIPVGDLRRGARTKVVLRIRATVGAETVKELAEVRWTFEELGRGARTETAVARAEVTSDALAIAAGRDQDTVWLVERAKTARALEEASTAYASGSAAQAETILRARAAEAATIAHELGDPMLGQEIEAVTARTQRSFASSPAASAPAGKKALKGGRVDAYELAR